LARSLVQAITGPTRADAGVLVPQALGQGAQGANLELPDPFASVRNRFSGTSTRVWPSSALSPSTSAAITKITDTIRLDTKYTDAFIRRGLAYAAKPFALVFHRQG
jgi:hypothetical protein